MSTGLFKKISAPKRVSRSSPARTAQWYTWSPAALQALRALSKSLAKFEPPSIIHLRRRRGYDYTFTLAHTRISKSPAGRDLAELTNSLLSMKPPDEVVFFTGLLDEQIDGQTLHYLIAILRDTITKKLRSEWGALYAPLATVGEDAGDFPLHCDLYVPELLWNIFEDVPTDGSGAAMFLESKKLLEILSGLKTVPTRTLTGIQKCLTKTLVSDRYTWFYDQLHGDDHPWTAALGRRLRESATSVCLGRGEGYLLHDRLWLHGRQKPKGSVSKKRVHRLVFDVEG
jgi:hypothetical protein